jgi:hypothetical protein
MHLLLYGSVTAVINSGATTLDPQAPPQRKLGSGSGAEESEALGSNRPSRLPSAASLSQGGSSVDAGGAGAEDAGPELGSPTAVGTTLGGGFGDTTPGASTGTASVYKPRGSGAGANSNAVTPAARPGTAGGAATPGGLVGSSTPSTGGGGPASARARRSAGGLSSIPGSASVRGSLNLESLKGAGGAGAAGIDMRRSHVGSLLSQAGAAAGTPTTPANARAVSGTPSSARGPGVGPGVTGTRVAANSIARPPSAGGRGPASGAQTERSARMGVVAGKPGGSVIPPVSPLPLNKQELEIQVGLSSHAGKKGVLACARWGCVCAPCGLVRV